MKRFINWLTDKFAPDYSDTGDTLRQSGVHKIPAAPRKTLPPIEPVKQMRIRYSGHVNGKVVEAGPGKNVLIRNKYVREDSGTHETLKIVDDSILESDDEIGIDPYNTGRFDRSRSWDSSRSRK
jgi:hypothetical protein